MPDENDEARKVILNINGELIIAGNRGIYPLLLKTNLFGDTVWTKQIVDIDTMYGQIRAMQPISDSGYVLAGVYGDSQHLSDNKIWVIRTDNEGNTVWSKLFTYGYASALSIDDDNNILVVGGAQLLKLNSSGDMIWNKTITGNYYYDFFSVKGTGANGFIIVGSSSSTDYKDLCLVKINYDGVKIWEKMYGGNYDEVGKDVITMIDKGYLVLGRASGRVWLMKTDSFGDTLWTQKFSISNDPFSAAYPQSFTISESNKIT
jgi:hypothetical protein